MQKKPKSALLVTRFSLRFSGVSFDGCYRKKPKDLTEKNYKVEGMWKVFDTQIQCKSCDKYFTKTINREWHERVHTGERPFPCNFCSKRFRREDTKRDHESLHLGTSPYKCEKCQKPFYRPGLFKFHKKTCNGKYVKRVACKVCIPIA